MKLLITIPCLNEELTIKTVIAAIPSKIEGISSIDILVVDDGSSDKTSNNAKELGAIVINHKQNLGVGEAFKTSYKFAVEHNYDLMVNMDGDNQFDSNEITLLVKPILTNKADLVIGSRFLNKNKISNMSNIKFIGNKLMAYLIGKITGTKKTDVSSGYRAYSKEALYNLNLHGSFTYTQETFLEFAVKKLTIVEVPITVTYYSNRKSRVVSTIFNYTVNTLFIILRGFRDFYPLRFFGSLTVLFFLPGAIFSSIFFYNYFSFGQFSGSLYAGFLGAFFIILSIIFSLIGLVADMLDRIRTNQERILYTLKKDKNNKWHKSVQEKI